MLPTFSEPLKIHKRQAELQVKLARPKIEEIPETDGKTKATEGSGALFLEAAKARNDDSGRMDWNNKVIMKLDSSDIAKIILGIRNYQSVNLYHSPGSGRSSALKIEAGQQEGTFKWLISKTTEESQQSVVVYLSQEDMYLAFKLMESALPIIHGWA